MPYQQGSVGESVKLIGAVLAVGVLAGVLAVGRGIGRLFQRQ